MSDSDKQALLNGTATIQTKIEIINEDDDNTILTEDDSIIDWNYEDFRYVKDEGWIGQFVARQITCNLKNLSDDFSITDKEFILWLGVRTNNNTNWYSLGNFLVTKVTDDEVKDKTSFEALDYTKKFNKEYEDTITYPCTALQLAQNVCTQCGVELATLNFKNYNYNIAGNVFINGESCRDVMKAIGKLAFSWVRVDWDNKVYIDFDPSPFTSNLVTPSSYNIINNNKYYTLETQKEKFGVVNRVVIGYSNIEGEKSKIEDATSIQENGLCEITVFDNPLVYTQGQRESIINSASDLLGLSYTPLNVQTVGHPWLKGNELVRVNDMENVSHNTIPFDRTIQYFGHIKTLINSSTPTKTNTELAYTPEMTKQLNRTEIIVDKQNQTITSIVQEIGDRTDKQTTITQDIDGIASQVQDIPTITTENEGTGSVYLSNLANVNLINLRIHPTDRDILGLFASNLLTVKSGLKVLSRGVTFDNTDGTKKDLYYKLPNNLYYYNENIYDEFIYDGKEEKIYVIRKVSVDGQGNKSVLDTPITEEYEFQSIVIEEGNYHVFMETYPTAYIYAKGMIKNDYTDLFATSYEVDSKIEQTANQITAQVNEKVDENEIIAKLNLAVENGQGIINLVGNTVTIDSDNFKLDEEGKINANAGDIGGFVLDNTSFKKNLKGIYNYVNDDLSLAGNILLGLLTRGTSVDYALDANNSGNITLGDISKIYNIIRNLTVNDREVTGFFEINSNDPKNCIIIKNNLGEIVTSIGLGGINTASIITDNFICGNYSITGTNFQYTGCIIRKEDGMIRITNATTEAYTEIKAGEILISDGQGHSKLITPTS